MGRKKFFTNRKKHNRITINRKQEKLKTTLKLTSSAKRPSTSSASTSSASTSLTSTSSSSTSSLSTSSQIRHIDPADHNMLRKILQNSIPTGWCLADTSNSQKIVLCHLEQKSEQPRILFTVSIDKQMSYSISAFNHKNIFLKDKYDMSSSNEVYKMLSCILKLKVCPGNYDYKYQQLAVQKEGHFTDRHGIIVATVDDYPTTTIRHRDCLILHEKPTRCSICIQYRKTLNKSISMQQPAKSQKKQTNHRFMGKSDMIVKIDLLQSQIRDKDSIIHSLERSIECDNERRSLDDTTHHDFLQIMQENHNKMVASYPRDSFQYIFWMSQYKAAMQSTSKHYRWHPAMIKVCIFLSHKSSKAYELLRKTNGIILPSQRTLRDYTHAFKSSVGFSSDLDNQLIKNSNSSTLEPHQKLITLIGDEMYIKAGLVYKQSGELIGFSDLGDINNHLLQLEHEYKNPATTNKEPEFATTMMTIMIRGIFSSFAFPYASFPTSTLTGEQLVPLFYEAIMRVERCGLKVTCITLDGNSVNRKFFSIIGTIKTNEIGHKFKNPLSDRSETREVFLFSDPPHLLKTARNCLANPKRNMQLNGKSISWEHIKKLYHLVTETKGLSTVHKLKFEHIYLTGFSKMRVDLAAEVLSQSVACGLRLHIKDAEETANFAEKFDKFFDILNVKSYSESIHKLKKFKQPYRWGNDARIEWLKEFLEWLKNWEEQTKRRTDLRKSERNKLVLSSETLFGVQLTVYSFSDLIKYIFTIPSVKSFLSERISQDPLEKFFGEQRQRGRTNESPTVDQFLKNSQALRVVGSIKIDTAKGNTRGTNTNNISGVHVSSEPLPKRRRLTKAGTISEINTQSSVFDNIPDGSTNALHDDETASFQASGISILGIILHSLQNGEFDFETEEARIGKQAAKKIAKYIVSNTHSGVIENFQTYLFGVVNIWLSVRPTNSKIREQIWLRFCQFTSSDEYNAVWRNFHDAVGVDYSPILAFYTTLQLLYRLWTHHYPTTSIQTSEDIQHLTYDEQNSLWYVAGYIIRKLRKTQNVNEEQLLLLEFFVDDSVDDENSDDDSSPHEEIEDTQSWLRMVDRGGLTKCSNDFYIYLRALEMSCKVKLEESFNQPEASHRDLQLLAEAIMKDTDVQSNWESLLQCHDEESGPETSHWRRESAATLQRDIIKLYLKIRCYAYTKRTVEHYKQANSQSLDKSKSFRGRVSLHDD